MKTRLNNELRRGLKCNECGHLMDISMKSNMYIGPEACSKCGGFHKGFEEVRVSWLKPEDSFFWWKPLVLRDRSAGIKRLTKLACPDCHYKLHVLQEQDNFRIVRDFPCPHCCHNMEVTQLC